MARTLNAGPAVRHRPLPLADLDHGLGTTTLALGVLGVLLVVLGAPEVGVWVGVLGMAAGLWAQMVSRTRPERFVDMAGLLLSFLAVATAISQGAAL